LKLDRLKQQKIVNDPVYGFIHIPTGIIFDVIQHPIFQRLRRIKQLGLATLVYPGAEHTRFQHAIGAFHLMTKAINVLQQKGIEVSEEEKEAAQLAILLHDIGHGPFSHSLEGEILPFHHETLTEGILDLLNSIFNGQLDLAIRIFKGNYPKFFLHELVSSQLDVDRLDYLNRDRFFTGVSEGVIGYDRIIHMLNVHDGRLVVEEKGIYSVEKFLVSRRIMYWQVYLHKTSVAAENMLKLIIQFVRKTIHENKEGISPALYLMLTQSMKANATLNNETLLAFTDIDDIDIIAAVKQWRNHPNKIVAFLSSSLYNRNLYKTKIGDKKEIQETLKSVKEKLLQTTDWTPKEIDQLIVFGKAKNNAYKTNAKNILIQFKDGSVKSIESASDDLDIKSLSKTVTKEYITFPRI
jgi:HD superfamily phosphohydrolase